MSFSVSELRSRHSRSLLILGLATFNAAGLAMTGLPFWLLWATPDPGLGQGGRLFMLGYLWALTWLFTWLAQRRFDFEEDFRGWSVALTGVGWGALYWPRGCRRRRAVDSRPVGGRARTGWPGACDLWDLRPRCNPGRDGDWPRLRCCRLPRAVVRGSNRWIPSAPVVHERPSGSLAALSSSHPLVRPDCVAPVPRVISILDRIVLTIGQSRLSPPRSR